MGLLCSKFVWALEEESPENQQFLPPPQTPQVFTARSYGDLSSWSWNPGLCGLAWGWNPLLPRYNSQLLSTTHECNAGPPVPPPLYATLRLRASLLDSMSLPLLPIWMIVASLTPWLLDFHTAQFSNGSR